MDIKPLFEIQMNDTSLEKKVKQDKDLKEKFFRNIEKYSETLESYYSKHPEISSEIPEVKFVVYAKTAFPMIYQTPEFFYLGGQNIHLVLRSKCFLTETSRKVKYYEVIASEQDIFLGKSPIVPFGCPKNVGKYYPVDMVGLEVKL